LLFFFPSVNPPDSHNARSAEKYILSYATYETDLDAGAIFFLDDGDADGRGWPEWRILSRNSRRRWARCVGLGLFRAQAVASGLYLYLMTDIEGRQTRGGSWLSSAEAQSLALKREPTG